jgi:ATP-dependent DNA helicase PIF1
MMHGPCGTLNPNNIRMKKDGSWKNRYPKQFCDETTIGNDSFQ